MWGAQGDDTFTVSSEKSAGGDNALILNRGDNKGQWGFGIDFSQAPEAGVLKVEYNVLFDGPGNQAAIGFEIRERISGRSIVSAFGVQDFAVRDAKRKKVFEITRDTWYHVTFTVPLSETDGKVKSITIRELKGDKSATLESEMTAYPSKLGQFLVNTHPDKNNYRIFFDDVKVSVETR
ncbi:hypothetical protein SDC9_134704 [bioreactor metagenome]|uniref:CBM11 domain-containing protein n=1 Tax=bioreactor metagenome TaxID=1076179 RepID=A0A645DDV7_9ZZZZ